MSNQPTPSQRKLQTDGVIEIAAHLAVRDVVRVVHVVTPNRPTYNDLVHYREVAESEGLSLTVDAQSVVIRPKDARIATDAHVIGASEQQPHLHVPRVAVVSWHWLHDHAVAWQAAFSGLKEGVR